MPLQPIFRIMLTQGTLPQLNFSYLSQEGELLFHLLLCMAWKYFLPQGNSAVCEIADVLCQLVQYNYSRVYCVKLPIVVSSKM